MQCRGRETCEAPIFRRLFTRAGGGSHGYQQKSCRPPLDVGQDNFRVSLGQFAVYRTSDAGKIWEPLTNGLPGPQSYQSVYREGLDTDGLDQEGVYVGTSNGQVFASNNGGDHWQRLPGDLPPVLSITAAVID